MYFSSSSFLHLDGHGPAPVRSSPRRRRPPGPRDGDRSSGSFRLLLRLRRKGCLLLRDPDADVDVEHRRRGRGEAHGVRRVVPLRRVGDQRERRRRGDFRATFGGRRRRAREGEEGPRREQLRRRHPFVLLFSSSFAAVEERSGAGRLRPCHEFLDLSSCPVSSFPASSRNDVSEGPRTLGRRRRCHRRRNRRSGRQRRVAAVGGVDRGERDDPSDPRGPGPLRQGAGRGARGSRGIRGALLEEDPIVSVFRGARGRRRRREQLELGRQALRLKKAFFSSCSISSSLAPPRPSDRSEADRRERRRREHGPDALEAQGGDEEVRGELPDVADGDGGLMLLFMLFCFLFWEEGWLRRRSSESENVDPDLFCCFNAIAILSQKK